MKKVILFILTFFLSTTLFAQSNHSITIDGTNDFTTPERFETTSGATLFDFITWDASNIYIGISGSSPSGTVTDGNRVYHIYIDTDPSGSNGTTDGEAWRWDPTLPFNADYHYAFKTIDNSETKRTYSGGSWGNATITTSNYKASGYWELSMSRSDLGSPSSIKVLVYVEEDWAGGSICGGLPSDLFTNTTTQGAISFNNHYHGYTLDANYLPFDGNSKDYVLRKNTAFLSFDGSNDYVKYTDDATLGRMDGATDYTIEAWVFPIDGTVAEYDRVLQRYYSFAIIMYDQNNNGKVEDWYFQVKVGASWYYYNTEGDSTLTLDVWNHIAIINNSSDGSLKLFVNGSDVTKTGGYSNQSMHASVNSDNLYIGQLGNGDGYFGGNIDEVRLKNVAVAPADLHTAYDNAYYSDANTAGLFHFDEGTGTNTVNVPSGTNATLINGVGWNTNVTGLPFETTMPLPVQLTSFSATKTNAGVLLNWETATEVNNYGFEVQRATTDDFETIGFVNGHGNSNSPNSYTFVDNSASGNTNYRLKQIDTDGNFEYSDVIEVNGANLDKVVFEQNYPNPFNPSTTFLFSIPNNEFVTLAIYNSLGQKVANIANENMNAGTYNFNWNATEMTSGVYFARLNVGTKTQIQKIMLLK